jgi:hypothetical protein
MLSLLQKTFEREISKDQIIVELSKHLKNDITQTTQVEELANLLEKFIGSMVSALEVANQFTKDPHFGRAVSFGTGQIIQYCFDDEDLFPEREFGILGLLDDAYLVHRFIEILYQMYPHVKLKETKYVLVDTDTLQVVRALMPIGVCDALDRTCNSLVTIANAFFTNATRGKIDTLEQPKTLTIKNALSILKGKVK